MPRVKLTDTIFYKILREEKIKSPPLGEERKLSTGAYLLKVAPGNYWIISNDRNYADLPAYINWKGSSVKHIFLDVPDVPEEAPPPEELPPAARQANQ